MLPNVLQHTLGRSLEGVAPPATSNRQNAQYVAFLDRHIGAYGGHTALARRAWIQYECARPSGHASAGTPAGEANVVHARAQHARRQDAYVAHNSAATSIATGSA